MCESLILPHEVSKLPVKGFVEVSAIDFPAGQPGAVIFIAGCELRCPYCQAAHFVEKTDSLPSIQVDELVAALDNLRDFVQGVTITGGEAAIHTCLGELLQVIKEMGFPIKIDSHGLNHRLLDDWISAGLVDALAIDIKGPWHRYSDLVGRPIDMSRLRELASWLRKVIDHNVVSCEFRTTVHKALHSEEDLLDTARQVCGAPAYVIQPYKKVPGFDPGLREAVDYGAEELRELSRQIRELGIVGRCYVRGYECDDPA